LSLFPGPLARCACLECPGLASVPASREIDGFAVYAAYNSHTLPVILDAAQDDCLNLTLIELISGMHSLQNTA
jgi:hypothetical protein